MSRANVARTFIGWVDNTNFDEAYKHVTSDFSCQLEPKPTALGLKADYPDRGVDKVKFKECVSEFANKFGHTKVSPSLLDIKLYLMVADL